MNRSIILWLIAALLTIASAVYQRLTGPTYPLRGTTKVAGREISYALERTASSVTGGPVYIHVPDSATAGVLRWRPLRSDLPWSTAPMVLVAGTRRAELPPHPPLTKLEYAIELTKDGATISVPAVGVVPIRFKGDVPSWVIIPHVLAMFIAMLLSTRAGLEALFTEPTLQRLTTWTLVHLLVGGFIFGPLMTHYAFNEWWTGWPVGPDVTDSKTLVAFVGWACAALLLKKPRLARWGVLFASVVMLVIFLIPHSI